MYHRYRLKNNSQAIFAPIPNAKTVTVLVMVKVGSRFEAEKLAGVAHFLEHMLFKGNKKYPTTHDLSATLDAVGADFNAFTWKEHTGYYVKLASEHLPLAIDVVSQMLLTSKLEQKEMNKEREVIVEEMHLYRDNPSRHIHDLLYQEMFSNSPLGRDTTGTAETVRRMKREEMVKFWKTHYRGKNVVVAVAGGFELEEVEKLVSKSFSFDGGIVKGEFVKHARKQQQPRVRVEYRDTGQVQLALGFPAFSYNDPRRYALSLLSTIMGGNMSSRLFIKIRERQGLCYSIWSTTASFIDTGSFEIIAGLSKDRIEEAIRRIRAVVDEIGKNGVSERELRQAKEYSQGKLLLKLEDTAEIAHWFAEEALFQNEIETPDQLMERLRKVTREEIKKTAQTVLRWPKVTLALIGPFQDTGQFRKLLL
ncbi:MAG: pitrilysin family protein [bacterium]